MPLWDIGDIPFWPLFDHFSYNFLTINWVQIVQGDANYPSLTGVASVSGASAAAGIRNNFFVYKNFHFLCCHSHRASELFLPFHRTIEERDYDLPLQFKEKLWKHFWDKQSGKKLNRNLTMDFFSFFDFVKYPNGRDWIQSTSTLRWLSVRYNSEVSGCVYWKSVKWIFGHFSRNAISLFRKFS